MVIAIKSECVIGIVGIRTLRIAQPTVHRHVALYGRLVCDDNRLRAAEEMRYSVLGRHASKLLDQKRCTRLLVTFGGARPPLRDAQQFR
jgi:hypothetical protein